MPDVDRRWATGATFVYVTHDQGEALALSDRIAVFERGRIAQLDSPENLYRRPGSAATARFVGDANVLPVTVASGPDGHLLSLAGLSRPCPDDGAPPSAGEAWLVVRQEDMRIVPAGAGDDAGGLRGTVRDVGFRGSGYSYVVVVGGLAEEVKVEAPANGSAPHAPGAEVTVSWDSAAARLLPRDGQGS